MAIQFPNFLAAQTQAPDYSGIGDIVENFYKGYHMPNDALIKKIQAQYAPQNAENDALIKRIQAQFAQPNAEAGLQSTKLGNKKSQMDIDKEAIELDQTRQLYDQLRKALAMGQAAAGGAAPSTAGMPPMSSPPAMTGGGMPAGSPPVSMPPTAPGNNPGSQAISNAVQAAVQNAQGGSPVPLGGAPRPNVQGNPAMPVGMPNLPAAPAPNAMPDNPVPPPTPPSPPEEMHEVVVSKGAPQLSGIDAMYDSNPLSREFLEKKGFKKTQEVKFDNKTGRTNIITKYPSGKVTVVSTGNTTPTGEGAPLTNAMVTRHQKVISSIDNALPTIQKILDEKGFQPYPRSSGLVPGMGYVPGFMSQSTKYEALVKSALDSLIGAYGLPMTNEGINTVKDQLLIGHGETTGAYRKRLKELMKDLERRKSYSASEVKRTNKISPIDSSVGGAGADSDVSNMSDDELRNIANGS